MVTCEGFMVFFLAVPTVSPTQSTSEIFIKKRVVTLLFPGEEVGKENDQILVTTRACYNRVTTASAKWRNGLSGVNGAEQT